MALTFEDGYQYDDGEAHWENLKAVPWFQEQDARSKHPVPDADQHRDSDSHNREAQKAAGEALLGRRLTMLWPAEGEWFQGTVVRFHGSGQHIIEWDDREISIHDLDCERVQWITDALSPAADRRTNALDAELPTPRMERRESTVDQGCARTSLQAGLPMPPGLEEL